MQIVLAIKFSPLPFNLRSVAIASYRACYKDYNNNQKQKNRKNVFFKNLITIGFIELPPLILSTSNGRILAYLLCKTAVSQ